MKRNQKPENAESKKTKTATTKRMKIESAEFDERCEKQGDHRRRFANA